jgi:hydroxymethylglutaryl-CoA synthase
MAATAVMRLIEQYEIDPREVRFLGFGTESSTDNSAGAVILKGMVDKALKSKGLPTISRSCEVPEYKHACLGGVYAMKGAIRYLATDGRGSKAIVVCADIAEYARGSSGEPTQGAGAVAMLIEENPAIASVDLSRSGSASDYRGIDFRKPMVRFCGQDRRESHQVQDFPLFNGKYSTTCYVDETLHALNDMYAKRNISAIDHLRSLETLFMHRPYRRMPETGLSLAYLFALAGGSDTDHAELEAYGAAADIPLQDLLDEMRRSPDVAGYATEADHQTEAYPLAMLALKAFRQTDSYQTEILDKLSLGAEKIRDLGNLYTAAMPAWFAAGLESALENDLQIDGQELLTLGYGSGDAAEVIPFFVEENWREAAAKICFSKALEPAVDVTFEQYARMHEGKSVPDLTVVIDNEFVIDSVGQTETRHFQDLGIEYYQYIGPRRSA